MLCVSSSRRVSGLAGVIIKLAAWLLAVPWVRQICFRRAHTQPSEQRRQPRPAMTTPSTGTYTNITHSHYTYYLPAPTAHPSLSRVFTTISHGGDDTTERNGNSHLFHRRVHKAQPRE